MHFGERICRVRVEPAARASDGKDGSCQEARAYKRRPRSIDATKIKRIMDEGVGASAVAKKLGIGRASPLKLPKCARKRDFTHNTNAGAASLCRPSRFVSTGEMSVTIIAATRA